MLIICVYHTFKVDPSFSIMVGIPIPLQFSGHTKEISISYCNMTEMELL